MKYLRSNLSLLMVMIITCLALAGCGTDKPAVIPFTELTLENSYSDMISLEGETDTTADSTYGGTDYIYPKEYLGLDGELHYMYDEDNRLVCISWIYYMDGKADVATTYNEIKNELESSYGESGYNTDAPSGSASKWTRDEGNITLMSITTETISAIQYSYLHPLVSSKQNK